MGCSNALIDFFDNTAQEPETLSAGGGLSDPNAIIDPVRFQQLCWPDLHLYDKQREIMYSVRDNKITLVPAGNQLGKDFVAALTALWFFCSRRPARVVTTSVGYEQLNDVLWGELRRFITTSRVQLPIHYNHMRIRQVKDSGEIYTDYPCELVGRCVGKGESILGRHLPYDVARTLLVIDEASGFPQEVYEKASTWARRILIIGNPFPTTNFFYTGAEEGSVKLPGRSTYHRKVIKITADDSPNVQYARAEVAAGREPSGRVLVPGVKDYETYVEHREVWDPKMQCIGLDAEFYKGAEVFMFPPVWMNNAHETARTLVGKARQAEAIGCDPAEGGDSTVWAIVDHLGLIKLISMKTPDTSVIATKTLELISQYGVDPANVLFDRGGGGKEHADYLRHHYGYEVRTVAFGEAVKDEERFVPGMKTIDHRKDVDETRYVYKDRRAQMYNLLRQRLRPVDGETVFALPTKVELETEQYEELYRQLAPIPLNYDKEGRLFLPPKRKTNPESKEVTLTDMLGCSPDEADALVLAVYGLEVQQATATIY